MKGLLFFYHFARTGATYVAFGASNGCIFYGNQVFMGKFLKFLLLFVILGGASYGVYRHFSMPAGVSVGALVSEKLERKTIRTTISATGSLEPVDKVEVGTQVSGDIAKIFVDYNSKVKKGQILAELDKSKLQAALLQAEIAYSSAENDYKYKQSTFERTKKLAENGSSSAVDLETAEYNMNSAKFSMERSKNEVEQAKLNLSYATIKSPINGVVLERSVDVGQTVAASMSAPTLFILAKDLKQMKVMADVDEADVGAVKAGQSVEFTVDAFLEDTFKGKIQEVRLNPTTTSNVVTYTVVITADNSDLKLLPGMTATCTIITKEVQDALALPVKATKFSPAEGTPMLPPPDGMGPPPGKRPEGAPAFGSMPPPGGPMGFGGPAKKRSGSRKPDKGPKFVWVNVNDTIAPRKVKVGLSDGVYMEVLHGLSEGDSVVVSQEDPKMAKKTSSDVSSPFMPGPPGRKKK